MNRTALALAIAALLAGCASSSTDPGGGSSSSKGKSTVARNDGGGKGCELKNPTGTGPCEDGRGAKATASASGSKAGRPFRPSDCTTYGLGGYALLAELGSRMSEWKAYCSAQEAARSPSGSSAGQGPASGNDGQGGTWFCEDRVDGSGNYGTFEMTRNTGRFYACKRVN